MQPTRKLWCWLGVVFVASFAVLGWLGREIYLAAPPIPTVVQDADGGEDWLRGGHIVATGPALFESVRSRVRHA